jgi:hypothetical protein
MPKKPCCTKEEKALGKLAQKIAKTVKLKPRKKIAMQPKPVYMENNSWSSKGSYFEPQHMQMIKAPLNPYAQPSKNALSLSDIQNLFSGAPTAQSLDLQDMMLENRLKELDKYKPPPPPAPEEKEKEIKKELTKREQKQNKKYELILERAAHIPVEDRNIDYNKLFEENLKLVDMKNPNIPVVSSYPHKTPEDLEENLGRFKISDDKTYYKTKVYYDDDIKEEEEKEEKEEIKPEDKYAIKKINGKRVMSNGHPINISQMRYADIYKLCDAYNIKTTKQNKIGGMKKKPIEELQDDIRLYEKKEGITELMRIITLID